MLVVFAGLKLDTSTWVWQWTLATRESLIFHLLVCVVYDLSVRILKRYVDSQGPKYKKPFWVESYRLFHNILLSSLSLWMFLVLLYETYQDGRYQSWNTAACQTTPLRGSYGFANFVYLISKLVEWPDTWILVLSNKPVITLHWFHHMTTFTMAALTHNFPVGGYALINCLVHVVMYLHYAFPQKWARIFITSSQLIQFVWVLSVQIFGFISPKCHDMGPVFWEWVFCFGVVAAFFLGFIHFFIQEYIMVKPKSSKKKSN